jgi:hypothetical protein
VWRGHSARELSLEGMLHMSFEIVQRRDLWKKTFRPSIRCRQPAGRSARATQSVGGHPCSFSFKPRRSSPFYVVSEIPNVLLGFENSAFASRE